MKKVLLWVIIIQLLIIQCSCNRYTSSFEAIGLVRSQTSHSCEASFYALKQGQLVFKIKKTDRSTSSIIPGAGAGLVTRDKF